MMIIDDIDDYDSNNDDDIARTKMKKTSMKIRFFPFRPFFQIFLFLFRSLPGHLRILHHSFLAARKSPFLQLQSLDQSPSSTLANSNYDEDDNDIVEEEENASQKSPFFAASQD